MAVSGRESPSEQHYSLKWNDYSVKLVTAFQSLRDEEDFVDVTVACDGHQYSAHKMVLSACSPYFRSMLRANPCQHPIVILKDVGHNEMERLLEFMYNGEVNIAQDQLAAFLRTAENLKIRGLAGSSDDMEQIYNRDYGNMSTSDKLFNQQQQLQQQQQNSTSVSAIASTNNSSGPHNEHNHQGLNIDNGFAKEESNGLSLSGGGSLSVPTTDCYSPAPKKRKLVMLNNTEQDCITDGGDAALDGSDNANSVGALVSQGSPLGVEVKCLSRDLKAEPCEASTEAGLTAGGEAVYSSRAGCDDTAPPDQILAPHLYTIGVGGSTGVSGGATHHDLNSAAQHNDQGAVIKEESWSDEERSPSPVEILSYDADASSTQRRGAVSSLPVSSTCTSSVMKSRHVSRFKKSPASSAGPEVSSEGAPSVSSALSIPYLLSPENFSDYGAYINYPPNYPPVCESEDSGANRQGRYRPSLPMVSAPDLASLGLSFPFPGPDLSFQPCHKRTSNSGEDLSAGGDGNYHRVALPRGSTPGVYPCPGCDKVFRHPRSFYQHQHVHRGTHSCPSCSKLFSRRWDLLRHLNKNKFGCPAKPNKEDGGSGGPTQLSRGIGKQSIPLPTYHHLVQQDYDFDDDELLSLPEGIISRGGVHPEGVAESSSSGFTRASGDAASMTEWVADPREGPQ